MHEQNVFQKIIAGEIPADIVHEDSQCIAFHDIAPQAPTHILVIPRKPIRSVADLPDEDGPLVAAHSNGRPVKCNRNGVGDKPSANND